MAFILNTCHHPTPSFLIWNIMGLTPMAQNHVGFLKSGLFTHSALPWHPIFPGFLWAFPFWTWGIILHVFTPYWFMMHHHYYVVYVPPSWLTPSPPSLANIRFFLQKEPKSIKLNPAQQHHNYYGHEISPLFRPFFFWLCENVVAIEQVLFFGVVVVNNSGINMLFVFLSENVICLK